MNERSTIKTRAAMLVGATALLLTGAWARAQLAGVDAPPYSTVTYRGYLEHDGQPVDGTIALSVDLFDAPSAGVRLTSSAFAFDGVQVAAGQFSIELELQPELLRRPEVWLAIGVDTGEGLVALEGRQRLTSVPYAQLARSAADGNPPGSVVAFAGTMPPSGWLPCDGAEVGRTQYPALFAAIGTVWGDGDGSTTFNLPDLRGRAAIGAGQGASLSPRSLGQLVGEETHRLTVAEMPAHTHGVTTVPSWDDGGGYSGGGWFGDPRPIETASTGGDQPHNVMQPSAVLGFMIKY